MTLVPLRLIRACERERGTIERHDRPKRSACDAPIYLLLDISNESDDAEFVRDDPDDQGYNSRVEPMRKRNIIIYSPDSDEDVTSGDNDQATIDPLSAGPSRSRPIRSKQDPLI
ncbi:hypothetical protein EVAR_60111_1 [Eumeta japonica]|uniref:Uncharacterized protein n=1 Tax=Eumeta variegata TaxID=151549 RepID=A0A4C1Z6G9_EUMVA|nr:hypothetical protein EVAR_60111_1 [Eumeta japonica]